MNQATGVLVLVALVVSIVGCSEPNDAGSYTSTPTSPTETDRVEYATDCVAVADRDLWTGSENNKLMMRQVAISWSVTFRNTCDHSSVVRTAASLYLDGNRVDTNQEGFALSPFGGFGGRDFFSVNYFTYFAVAGRYHVEAKLSYNACKWSLRALNECAYPSAP